MPGVVHCNLSSICTVFSMEGELQSPLHRAALGFPLDVVGAMGSPPGDRIRSVFQRNAYGAGYVVCIAGKEFPA